MLKFTVRPCMGIPTYRIEIPFTWKIVSNTVYYEGRTVCSDWCRCGALSEKRVDQHLTSDQPVPSIPFIFPGLFFPHWPLLFLCHCLFPDKQHSPAFFLLSPMVPVLLSLYPNLALRSYLDHLSHALSYWYGYIGTAGSARHCPPKDP